MLTCGLILSGFGIANGYADDIDEDSDQLLDQEIIISKENATVLDFSLDNHVDALMYRSNGWSNGSMFDCTWREKNVTFVDGKMRLRIDIDDEGGEHIYSGAEYRTHDFYHYGLYEVSMKPINHSGVVSSFFTYTGESDGNPWDEIDIEFVGKDTSKVQFNYFTDGRGHNEYYHDLGFDASEEFHTYAFEWLPDGITWFVDGEIVHSVTDNIPSTPGRLMMNVWPGINVDDWLGVFDGQTPLSAEYDWFRITQYEILGTDEETVNEETEVEEVGDDGVVDETIDEETSDSDDNERPSENENNGNADEKENSTSSETNVNTDNNENEVNESSSSKDEGVRIDKSKEQDKSKPTTKERELPKTGESNRNSVLISILGMTIMASVGFLAIFKMKEKKN